MTVPSFRFQTGRFLQHDPIGYIDGLNLYEYVSDNPIKYIDSLGMAMSLSGKIEGLLALRAYRGGSLIFNIYNRFRNNYEFEDELNEMNQSLGEDIFRFYADAINRHKSSVDANKDKWTLITVPPPQPSKEWRTGLTGLFPGLNFWLHGAIDIRSDGQFEAKLDCNDRYMIRRINVEYEWYDEIDANNGKELRSKGQGPKAYDFYYLETGWNVVGDGVLGSAFYVTIKWSHQMMGERDITNYVNSRGGIR